MRWLTRLCVALLPLVAAAQAPELYIPSPIDTPPLNTGFDGPRALFGADLDGDGDDDLVVGDREGVKIALGAHRGGWFEVLLAHDAPWPDAVAALDIDLDGDVDLVYAAEGQVVLLRRGLDLADWTPEQLFAGDGVGAWPLSVADIDGDQRPDLAINDPQRHVVLSGAGPMAPARLSVGEYPQWAARFVDFDGDGDLDTVVGAGGVATLRRNDGQLPWAEVTWGDLAGDGRPMFLANVDPSTPGAELIGSSGDNLRIAANNGGAMGPWVLHQVDAPYDGVALDADADGDLDVATVVATVQASAAALRNPGDGQITGGFQFLTGQLRFEPSTGFIQAVAVTGPGATDLLVDVDHDVPLVTAMRPGVLFTTASYGFDPSEDGLRIKAFEASTQVGVLVGPFTLTTARVMLLADGQAMAPERFVERVEIFLETSGNGGFDAGDSRVGVVEGAALQTVTEVPLAGAAGLRFTQATPPRLYAFVQLRRDVHLVAREVAVGWQGVSARNDAGPVPVADRMPATTVYPQTNAPPVAGLDFFEVLEGRANVLPVLDNDADPRGDPLQVELVGLPEHGVAEVAQDGTVIYTHDGDPDDFLDRITYRAVDPLGARSEVVGVQLAITPTNDAPVAVPDHYVTAEDTPLLVEPDLGPLLNDTDEEGDVLTSALVDGPTHGQLELAPDGGFVYFPAPDFHGVDRFTYVARDGELSSAPATVTIDILPVNDPPRPSPARAQTPAGQPVRLSLSAGDPDEGLTRLYLTRFPDHGHLFDLDPEAAEVTYRPPPGFVGEARFEFRLTDGTILSPPVEAVVQVGDAG